LLRLQNCAVSRPPGFFRNLTDSLRVRGCCLDDFGHGVKIIGKKEKYLKRNGLDNRKNSFTQNPQGGARFF
jgi:hypothetical protein